MIRIQRLAILLLLAAAPSIQVPAQPPGGTTPEEARFFFVQLSDPQFGFFEENRSFQKETENFERAVDHLNRLRPALVVITGDLVHRSGDAAEAAEYLRILRRIDAAIPVHSVPGNHDVENSPTPASLAWFRSTIGPTREVFRHGGSTFILFNSSLLSSSDRAPREAEEESSWLQGALREAARARPEHLFLFQHHPWFIGDPEEKDDYFNLPLPRRRALLPLLRESGVRAAFAGHLHRCEVSRRGSFEMVVTGPVGKPLGKDPSGLRIVWVFAGRIEHRYYGLDQVPASVSLRGPRDRGRF